MYLTIVFVGMVAVTLVNWLALGWSFFGALGWTAATTGIELGIMIVFAFLAGVCTPRCFYREGKIYAVGKREIAFYRAVGLPKWKDHVLELGIVGGFSKKQLVAPNDPQYIDKFIFEINKGMFVHWVGIMASFLILAVPVPGLWSVRLPVALVCAVLNILPVMVLRYNKPRLLLLKKRLLRNQPVDAVFTPPAAVTLAEEQPAEEEQPAKEAA